MKEVKNNLILKTLGVWRPRTASRLSEEDARNIAENIAGFFTILLEWEAREKEKENTESRVSYYAKSA